ncbi:hypothetical protein CYMTET_21672 [Cymbomonas tetramitiformis]|uniref:Uncharacterized protein n=1 Tax=Cymbomonas tetramitiformis TaxID=36881 RepID=A0AAE0G1Q7_9CHLO|nr:hypothetical protein CYMTET_21672 [Cymbomonas tetramitiformis]
MKPEEEKQGRGDSAMARQGKKSGAREDMKVEQQQQEEEATGAARGRQLGPEGEGEDVAMLVDGERGSLKLSAGKWKGCERGDVELAGAEEEAMRLDMKLSQEEEGAGVGVEPSGGEENEEGVMVEEMDATDGVENNKGNGGVQLPEEEAMEGLKGDTRFAEQGEGHEQERTSGDVRPAAREEEQRLTEEVGIPGAESETEQGIRGVPPDEQGGGTCESTEPNRPEAMITHEKTDGQSDTAACGTDGSCDTRQRFAGIAGSHAATLTSRGAISATQPSVGGSGAPSSAARACAAHALGRSSSPGVAARDADAGRSAGRSATFCSLHLAACVLQQWQDSNEGLGGKKQHPQQMRNGHPGSADDQMQPRGPRQSGETEAVYHIVEEGQDAETEAVHQIAEEGQGGETEAVDQIAEEGQGGETEAVHQIAEEGQGEETEAVDQIGEEGQPMKNTERGTVSRSSGERAQSGVVHEGGQHLCAPEACAWIAEEAEAVSDSADEGDTVLGSVSDSADEGDAVLGSTDARAGARQSSKRRFAGLVAHMPPAQQPTNTAAAPGRAPPTPYWVDSAMLGVPLHLEHGDSPVKYGAAIPLHVVEDPGARAECGHRYPSPPHDDTLTPSRLSAEHHPTSRPTQEMFPSSHPPGSRSSPAGRLQHASIPCPLAPTTSSHHSQSVASSTGFWRPGSVIRTDAPLRLSELLIELANHAMSPEEAKAKVSHRRMFLGL